MKYLIVLAGPVLALFLAAFLLLQNAGPTQIGSTRSEEGVLKSRTVLLYDHASGGIVRKAFSAWNMRPERSLEFDWLPDDPSAGAPALIEGAGELTWRYPGEGGEGGSVESVYRGGMKDGRPEGLGDLRTRQGHHYAGAWRDGRYEGRGRLQLPDGSSYEGDFKAGLFHGHGTLFDVRHGTYIGEFAAGLKHGEGTTRLDGDAAFHSVWRAGSEVAGTRRIRLAQSGDVGSNSPLARRELQIAAIVDFFSTESLYPEDPLGRRASAGYNLRYAIKNEAASFTVYPDDKALMLQWKGGGLITCERRYAHMQVHPVPLTFKLVNRSAANIKIISAGLEVIESDADLQPLVVEDCTAPRVLAGFDPFLRLKNFGWGNPVRATATLRFVPQNGSGPAIVSSLVAGDLKSHEIDLDLTRTLASLGVKVDPLKRWSGAVKSGRRDGVLCSSGRVESSEESADRLDRTCLSQLKRSGVLGQLSRVAYMSGGELLVGLEGELMFDWIDAKGVRHKYIAPFERDVRLGSLTPQGDSEGAGPSDRDPRGTILVELNLGRSNYDLSLPYAGVIAPSQTADLKLAIKTRKSAKSRFRLKLRTEDGRVFESKPVDLQTFIAKMQMYWQ